MSKFIRRNPTSRSRRPFLQTSDTEDSGGSAIPTRRGDLPNLQQNYEQLLLSLSFERLPARMTEPFAEFDYGEECAAKTRALRAFLSPVVDVQRIEPIIPSPLPRQYRTTTKRRVFVRGHARLVFSEEKNPSVSLSLSKLEPENHLKIYRFLQEKLSTPAYLGLASKINHIILRGNYRELGVILNLTEFSGDVIRKAKALAEHLRALSLTEAEIISVSLYLDPTRSVYYLEKERPQGKVTFKTLYGPEKLFLKLGEKKWGYSITSFSQINEAILPSFLEGVRSLAPIPRPHERTRLVDLYCGYGLFTHYLSPFFSECLGIDNAPQSIQSAEDNSRFHRAQGPVRFISTAIHEKSLQKILGTTPPSMTEFFLLDPPRQGTAAGVIDTIATRQPERAVHIFCGTEAIPLELSKWERVGYSAERIIPYDLFPGTLGLESVILFSKDKTLPSKRRHIR